VTSSYSVRGNALDGDDAILLLLATSNPNHLFGRQMLQMFWKYVIEGKNDEPDTVLVFIYRPSESYNVHDVIHDFNELKEVDYDSCYFHLYTDIRLGCLSTVWNDVLAEHQSLINQSEYDDQVTEVRRKE
jgi:hypothetical protein